MANGSKVYGGSRIKGSTPAKGRVSRRNGKRGSVKKSAWQAYVDEVNSIF